MRTICCVFLFFFLCAGGYARKNTPAGQIFQADFVDMIVTNGLSVEHRPGFLQLQGIRTVFHPAVYRYMSQPADRNSISRQAL